MADIKSLDDLKSAVGAAAPAAAAAPIRVAVRDKLGRSYFPLVRVDDFNNSERDRLVADIRQDLDVSKIALAKLPDTSRRAVTAALMFFEELNEKIARTPANELIHKRIRVTNPKKLSILFKAMLGATPK